MSMIRFDGFFAHESMSPEGWILPFVRNPRFLSPLPIQGLQRFSGRTSRHPTSWDVGFLRDLFGSRK